MEYNYTQLKKRIFFQDQIFSEMGFAATMSLFGAELQPYVAVRDPGSRALNDGNIQGWPALGVFLMSHPSSSAHHRAANQAYRQGTQLPKTDTFQPIPSSYFEYINQDEFWNTAVKQWGLEALNPRVDLQTYYIGPEVKGERGYSTPAYIQTGKRWYEDQAGPDAPTYSPMELALMSPAARQPINLALATSKTAQRMLLRARFRNGRSNFATTVREAFEAANFSWRNETLSETMPKLRNLSNVLLEEAQRMCDELCVFVFNRDQDRAHHTYLRELNHYMRNMAIDFDINHAQTSQDPGMMKAAKDIIRLTDICLVMLNDPNAGPAKSSKTYLQNVEKRITPALIQSLVLSGPQLFAARLDPTLKPGLLQQAKTAIAAKDTNQCTILWNTFMNHFSSSPFFRAVARILMAHDGTPENRLMCKNWD